MPAGGFLRLRLTPKDSPRGTRIDFEMRSGSTRPFRRGTGVRGRQGRQSKAGPFCPVARHPQVGLGRGHPGFEKRFPDHRLGGSAGVTERNRAGRGGSARHRLQLVRLRLPRPSFPRRRLVRQYRWKEVVAGGKTDLEKFALLRDWVHSQWLGWQAEKYPFCPTWDPLESSRRPRGKWGFGMCTHYGAVFAGCASALGYVARVSSSTTTAWPRSGRTNCRSGSSRMPDRSASTTPSTKPGGACRRPRVPPFSRGRQGASPDDQQAAAEDQGENDQVLGQPLLPLRDPFAEQPSRAGRAGRVVPRLQPVPWDGYLWWSDGIDPKYAEYSLQTSRPADFNWSVNQTRLYPRAGEEAGVLEVDVETATPNLSHFQVRTDGGVDGEWEEAAEGPLTWKLHPGENGLEVRGAMPSAVRAAPRG